MLCTVFFGIIVPLPTSMIMTQSLIFLNSNEVLIFNRNKFSSPLKLFYTYNKVFFFDFCFSCIFMKLRAQTLRDTISYQNAWKN